MTRCTQHQSTSQSIKRHFIRLACPLGFMSGTFTSFVCREKSQPPTFVIFQEHRNHSFLYTSKRAGWQVSTVAWTGRQRCIVSSVHGGGGGSTSNYASPS